MEGYRRGRVSSVDLIRGFVRVTYPQDNNYVSDWLPLLASEYNIPAPGDYVATVLDKDGGGVCMGKIYSYSQPPPRTDGGYEKDIDTVKITKQGNQFRVDFGDGAYISYTDGTLTFNATKIVLNGYTPQEET